MSASNTSPTETLDPHEWVAMRDLAHRMVDDAFKYLENVRERPAWQEVPAEVAQTFTGGVPLEPQGAEQAYEDFKERVMNTGISDTSEVRRYFMMALLADFGYQAHWHLIFFEKNLPSILEGRHLASLLDLGSTLERQTFLCQPLLEDSQRLWPHTV